MRILIVIMLLATCAGAQPSDPDPDGMSFYFDTFGVEYCLTVDDWIPGTGNGPTVTAYLLVTRPDTPFPQILAWEAHAEILTNSYSPPTGLTLTSGAADYDGDPDDYVVDLSHALLPITGDATVIAHVDISWLGYEGHAEATLILRSIEDSLYFPDNPGYAVEAGFPIPCQPLFGAWGEVAWINMDAPACLWGTSEDMTWGMVKRLY